MLNLLATPPLPAPAGPPAAAGTGQGAADTPVSAFARLLSNPAVAGQASSGGDPAATPVSEGSADAAEPGDAQDNASLPVLDWLFGMMVTQALPVDGATAVPAMVPVTPPATAGMANEMFQFPPAVGTMPSSPTPPQADTRGPLFLAADLAAPSIQVLQPAEAGEIAAGQQDTPMITGAGVSFDGSMPALNGVVVELRAVVPSTGTGMAQPHPSGSAPLTATTAEFVPELGERILWQLSEGLSEATIELHPAELGALSIRIETRGNEAQVHMVAAEGATRALLGQALPQLRELLAASGLILTRSQIDGGSRRDDRSGSERDPESDGRAQPGIRRRVTQVMLVDAYV